MATLAYRLFLLHVELFRHRREPAILSMRCQKSNNFHTEVDDVSVISGLDFATECSVVDY
jgi:hypothetical protein